MSSSSELVRNKKLSGQEKREELEKEVLVLRKMLDHEHKVHETLDQIHNRPVSSAFSVPKLLPPKMKELLTDLAMVEDEIARLESQIDHLQIDLKHEKEVNKGYKSKQLPKNMTPSLPPISSFSPMKRGDKHKTNVQFETKTLHFISKAIKGDYNLNDFSINEKSTMKSGNQNENNTREDAGFQEKVLSKSGAIKAVSPLRELRYQTPKRERNVEVNLASSPNPTANHVKAGEENIHKLPPNKLSEKIMKCLIFIFVRMLRTSRAMELEKSGPISKSSSFSLSFRADTTSSNSKVSILQKELRQQDPYGVFDPEHSMPRDIGPYKNMLVFTSSTLDLKCLSNSSSVPLVQRLRVLMNNLQKVDLRFLTNQQKLAFWINMYNACIMHGFLQYGVPSSPENFLTLMNKATLTIGGNTINAHAIEHFILRNPASSILKEVYPKRDNEDQEAKFHELYGLELSDPNITFALCCGTRSSPAVRIYTSDGIGDELEKSKLEYLQASIITTTTKRIALPELLLRNMHDFAPEMDSLVKWICHQLPTSGTLRKSMVDCFRGLHGGNNNKISSFVDKVPYDFEFQYLLSV